MHEVLVNRLGGLSLPRKSVVRLTDRPDLTLDVYRGRKTTMQQQQQFISQLMACMLVLCLDSKILLPKGVTQFIKGFKNWDTKRLPYLTLKIVVTGAI